MCAAQMIYFVFVALALGSVKAQNGAVIELTGPMPRLIYGQLDASDSLTLTRNASEDKLVCSGEFEASDLRIAGTSTSVADLIGEVAALRQEMAAVKAFVGMMPPPAVPPPHAPPPPATYSLVGSGQCSCDKVNIYNRQYAPSGYSTTSEAESYCSSQNGCTGYNLADGVVDFIWQGSGFSHSGPCGDGPPTDVFPRPDYSVIMCYRKQGVEMMPPPVSPPSSPPDSLPGSPPPASPPPLSPHPPHAAPLSPPVMVTCEFTADDIVDNLYVDNVDITSTVVGTRGSWVHVKTVSFNAPVGRTVVLAAAARDYNSPGGVQFILGCQSDNPTWGALRTQPDGNWRTFVGSPPSEWYQNDFEANAWQDAVLSNPGGASCGNIAPGNRYPTPGTRCQINNGTAALKIAGGIGQRVAFRIAVTA